MFLDVLPAELRVNVYHAIIERTILIENPSERQDERLYGGLIFSCNQVLGEYKFEAEKLMPALPPNMHDRSLYLNLPPVLIAPPSPLSFPTHMHISVPARLFVYEEDQLKDSEFYFKTIFPEVTDHHTRITFSLHDTEDFDSKMRVRACLIRLYNIMCELAIREMPDGASILVFHKYSDGYRCDFDEAKRMWTEKGYEVGAGNMSPLYNCDNVALHIQSEVVVYDARISRNEVRGADSGYLWEKGNAIRQQNKVRREKVRTEQERLKAWSEKLRLR